MVIEIKTIITELRDYLTEVVENLKVKLKIMKEPYPFDESKSTRIITKGVSNNEDWFSNVDDFFDSYLDTIAK